MTRSNDFTARFTAFTAALLLATVTLVASVGPAFVSFPVVA